MIEATGCAKGQERECGFPSSARPRGDPIPASAGTIETRAAASSQLRLAFRRAERKTHVLSRLVPGTRWSS